MYILQNMDTLYYNKAHVNDYAEGRKAEPSGRQFSAKVDRH